MIDQNFMSEETLQFTIKLFSICVALLVVIITGTFCYLVIHDGNNPLVNQAFNDLANIAGQAFLAITTIVVGKPIATGILQFLAGKGVQASTTNIPVTPNGSLVPPAQVQPGTTPPTPPVS